MGRRIGINEERRTVPVLAANVVGVVGDVLAVVASGPGVDVGLILCWA